LRSKFGLLGVRCYTKFFVQMKALLSSQSLISGEINVQRNTLGLRTATHFRR